MRKIVILRILHRSYTKIKLRILKILNQKDALQPPVPQVILTWVSHQCQSALAAHLLLFLKNVADQSSPKRSQSQTKKNHIKIFPRKFIKIKMEKKFFDSWYLISIALSVSWKRATWSQKNSQAPDSQEGSDHVRSQCAIKNYLKTFSKICYYDHD